MNARRSSSSFVWLLPAAAGLGLACSSVEAPTKKTGASSEALAPAVRRLSAAELDAAASPVLGKPAQLSAKLPPDTRQFDFSRNVAQTVDPLTLLSLIHI